MDMLWSDVCHLVGRGWCVLEDLCGGKKERVAIFCEEEMLRGVSLSFVILTKR